MMIAVRKTAVQLSNALALALVLATTIQIGSIAFWVAFGSNAGLTLAFKLVYVGSATAALLLLFHIFLRFGAHDAKVLSWPLVVTVVLFFVITAGAFTYGTWFLAGRS